MVVNVINKIIAVENTSYQNIFALLKRGQKLALKAISILEDGEAPFSAAFLKRAGVTTADGFRKALENMVKKGLIEKENGNYKIYDVFFREWLRRQGV